MVLRKFERDYQPDTSNAMESWGNDETSSYSQSSCLSIIIPTLNESENISMLLLRIDRAMKQAGIYYEVIIVDDHSTDSTTSLAAQTKAQYGCPVRVVMKQGRAGKSFSLIEGFAVANFDILVMIDGDLQYPPEAIPEMVLALDRHDIVVADRRSSYTHANIKRGKLSKSFDSVIGKGFFGINADLQSGLKVFRRQVYQAITLQPGRWSFDIEFLTRAKHQGFKIGNVPITFAKRHGGESKVSPASVGTELVLAAIRLRIILTVKSTERWLNHNGVIPQPEAGMTGALRLAVAQADTTKHKEINYYGTWLREEAALRSTGATAQAISAYVVAAAQPQPFKGRLVAPYTTLPRNRMALKTFTATQLVLLGLAFLGVSIALIVFGFETIRAIIALVIALYLSNLLVMVNITRRSLDKRHEESIDDEIVYSLAKATWPRYTILCPLFREVAVVPQFVAAMMALDYPQDRLQILFLTEEIDVATRATLQAMQLPTNFEILNVPHGQPQTKPRACNYGLMRATGDYVVIYDAEDIPDPLQLKKAVLTFANHDPNLACVQAKLNYYNTRQNLLTRLFTIEYSIWFDFIMPGLQAAKISVPLGGTSNHFRASILRKLGAWDPFNVTEDCDLGLRLVQHRMHTVILDSTTMEEANSHLGNWVRQRSRWIKGYMQTYLVHMRRPFAMLRPSRIREMISLQYIMSTSTVFFVNPVMWAMLLVYLLFRAQVEGLYHYLYPAPIFYAGMICLVFGNFLYLFIALLACAKREQYSLMKWALLLPLYWFMLSVAAMLALFQLILKPHYWEKTQHGLHLRKQQQTVR